jgi:cell division protein FtsI/penicillin-binding protein 2
MVHPLARWNSFTTTSVPMGHEVNVTPIQLARAFCVFANGGSLVQPHVLRAVLAADGRLVKDLSDHPPLGQVIPGEIAATMKDKLLSEVINKGTGTKAQLARYQVFGKTGTAQIARPEGKGYGQREYVGSFVAGAPAADPQLVVLVAIRRPDPSIGYYGGTISAPVVRGILAHALAYLQIPPDKEGGEDVSTATGIGGD